MTDAPAIQVNRLSHTYKPKRQRRQSKRHAPPMQDAALDRIDLTVNKGEIFALLGPNGSGKSTLLRILATVQVPRQTAEAGTACIFGIDLTKKPANARQQLGVVFQHPALDLKLTALENLRLHGKLYGLSGDSLEQTAKQALQGLGLSERMNDDIESFSGGMRRRVEIAKALLTKPRLLLMDEASAGLDLAIQEAIWDDLRKLVNETGLTVLLTTHLMHEAERADRVAIMSEGKVIAVDTPNALVAQVGGQILEITPASSTPVDTLAKDITNCMNGRLDSANIQISRGRLHLEHADAAAMIQPLSASLGDDAASFRLGRPNLGDAYLKLTGQALSE